MMFFSAVLLCLGAVGTLGLPTVVPDRPTVVPHHPPCQENQGSAGCWKYGVFCNNGEALAWDDWSDCNKCSYNGNLYEPGQTFTAGDEECMCPDEDGVIYADYRDPICIPAEPPTPPLVVPTTVPVVPTTVPSCQPWSLYPGCWGFGGVCINGHEILWTDWSGCPNWLRKKLEKMGIKIKGIQISEMK